MRHYLIKLFSILSLTMALSCAFAANETQKIAVINMQQILQQAPQVVKIKQSLENQFKPDESKIESLQSNLKSNVDKFKRNSAIMKAGDRNVLEKQIMGQQQQLQTMQLTFQQKAKDAQSKALASFFQLVNTAVAKIANKNNYDLVLIKNSTAYASNKFDITKQVLKALS